MLEKKIEERLRIRVRDILGGIAYKFVSPNHRSVPDRICLLPGGRVVFVECKSSKGCLTPGQEREIERLRDLGFFVEVVNSYESVDAVIDKLRMEEL